MIFDESDIQFEKLHYREFEELCYDVIMRIGFHSLIWRQGGADSGRDIEADSITLNTLVGMYKEKWFFECKCYKKGVPVGEISDKFDWADAEKPDHLVLIVSSYLSNDTRDWVKKRSNGKHYQTHIIEGKYLKSLIVKFPELIVKYFTNKYVKLFNDVKRNWVTLNIFPEPNILYLLDQKLERDKLTIADKAFFWCLWQINWSEIEIWRQRRWNGYQNINFSFKEFGTLLLENTNISSPILDEYDEVKSLGVSKTYMENDENNIHEVKGKVLLKSEQTTHLGLYCLKLLPQTINKGIEVLVEGDIELSVKIRYIDTDIRVECRNNYERLNLNQASISWEDLYYQAGRWAR